jgi:hypothetical protein
MIASSFAGHNRSSSAIPTRAPDMREHGIGKAARQQDEKEIF